MLSNRAVNDRADDLVAVYYPNRDSQERTLRKLRRLPRLGSDTTSYRYFSSWGKHLAASSSYERCAHYLAPLNRSFRRAIVIKYALPLYSASAVAPIVVQMLSGMGVGSEVLLQCSRSWLNIDELHGVMPTAKIEKNPDGARGWVKLSARPGIEADARHTASIYPSLAPRLDEFRQALIAAGHRNEDPDTNFDYSVEQAFSAGMSRVLHARTVFERFFQRYRLTAPLRGLDIGGSYGFLACELAAMGHHMTSLERVEWQVRHVTPWIAKACGVAERVEGIAGRMETLTGSDDSFDFVCFLGSLLLIDRSDVPDVLSRA